jgi:serine phosphatase RsbU (regulator of sigma subunit)/Tfp pilus assembly protein PilF
MKIVTKLLLVIASVFFIPCQAQDHRELDSLKNQLGSVHDSLKGKIYLRIADVYGSQDTVSFNANINKALQYAEKYKDIKLEATCYVIMGRNMHTRGNFEKAKFYFSKALQLDKRRGDLKLMAMDYSNLGNIEYFMSNFDKAIENYFLAQHIHDRLKNKESAASNYINLGNAYLALGQPKKALFFQKMAYDYFKKVGDEYTLAVSMSNLGDIYTAFKNEKKGIEFYEGSLALLQKLNNLYGVALLKLNLANSYKRIGSYQRALSYAADALEVDKIIGDPLQVSNAYLTLASIYNKLGQVDKALDANMKGYDIARNIQARTELILAFTNYAAIYKGAGDYKKALDYQVKAYELKDSIESRETSDRIADITGKYETGKKEEKIQSLEKDRQIQKLEIAKNTDSIRKQKYILFLGAGLIGLMILFLLSLFRSNNQRKKTNETLQQAYNVIDEKKKEILDSINYAKRLQEAILPPAEYVSEYFKEHFIVYEPKDIVAGDFYWMEQEGDLSFFAAADSTGHGVPGAMVSVVCSNALNRALKEFGLKDPGALLDKTRELVLETFGKSTQEVKDGMDISLMCYDRQRNKVLWAGANNPLWYISSGEFKEITANKQPIGKSDAPAPFATHEIQVKPGAVFYLFTDGFADQFGGPKGKKYKYKQLKTFLMENLNDPMEIQKQKIMAEFEGWKGELEQVDDVCIIGIRMGA